MHLAGRRLLAVATSVAFVVAVAVASGPLARGADSAVPPPAGGDAGLAVVATRQVALEEAVQGWLQRQPSVRHVAVGVAFVGRPEGTVSTVVAAPGEEAPSPGTTYGALSVTKTFTEALVLREAAAGRIDLDAPMPVLPGLPALGAGDPVITPRHLLQHSAGLVNYPDAVGYRATAAITPVDVVAMALRSPRLHAPGAKATYTNTAYHWLGLLLEHVTGTTYAQLVAGLAAEVGLPSTWVDPASRPGWVGFASGGVRSTAGDLARWGAALFDPGRVLPAEQAWLLTTVGPLGVAHGTWPVCPCEPKPTGGTRARGVGQVVADGGLVHLPEHGLVVTVHLDRTVRDPHAALAGVAAAVLESPLVTPRGEST